jgi:hypothetical protein
VKPGEPVPTTPKGGLLERAWAWTRKYRVWEANRKDFLSPENWIEPELRDDERSRPAQVKKPDP